MPSGDPFGPAYHLLGELQAKHLEMAQMLAEYQRLVEEMEENPEPDGVRLVRALPGARYHVASTYVVETWKRLDAELKRLFPPPE
jgi:hypothetical protein